MASIRDRILAATVTALQSGGGPSGLTVKRFLLLNNEPSDLPLIAVRPIREDVVRAVANRNSPLVERTMRVALDCRVVAGSGQSVDQTLDPILTWATKKLINPAAPSLGGLAIDVEEESLEWDGDDADQNYGRCTLTLKIRFKTKTEDPEN